MNSKYKPGIYFGIFIILIDIVIARFLHPEAFEGKHIWLLLVSSLIGGAIGGLVFGLTWNWVKKRQTDD